jgi:thioredoxin 1
MSDKVREISDSNFQAEVLEAKTTTLVDFWAPWCGPCKSIAPVLDELAKEFAGKLQIMKINVDDNPRTPSMYNVRGIPNLVIFKNGEVVEQLVGAVPKDQLVAAITQAI